MMQTRIAGINVMRTTLAVLDKKGRNAEQAVTKALNSLERTESECTKVIAPKLTGLESDRAGSSVALGSTFLKNEPSLIAIENGALSFHGRIYSPTFRNPHIVAIAESVSREGEQAIEKMILEFDGDFASIAAKPDKISAVRDPMGAQPLYYGETPTYAAIGSNRTVLWKLGIQQTFSFPPGNWGVATTAGFKFRPVKTLAVPRPKHAEMKTAVKVLLEILERAVRIRVKDEKEIAVAFSGGLDSSLIACLARKCDADVRLVHVSLEGHRETEEAKKAAEALNLPLSVHLFKEDDVANIVARVVELIEEPDPVKTAIGIPFYWVAQKCSENGLKVLLAGQGADELFGGYQRYSDEYRLKGEEKAKRTMFVDIAGIHESNLERDQKICSFHNVELRLPFASYEMAEFATSLPLELKIDPNIDPGRKLVLRKAAEEVGLPPWIASKPKKAVQYSTGVSSTLKKLARRRRITIREYVGQLFNGRQ